MSNTNQELQNTPKFQEQPELIEQRVQNLSAQLGTLHTDTIVPVPVYAGESTEETARLVETLKKQKYVGEKIVLYVNALGKFSKEGFQKKKEEVEQLIAGDEERFAVMCCHYDEPDRKPMGTIRSDMIDAISRSLAPSEKEPIIIGLDADLKSISNTDYFEKQRAFFDAEKNKDRDWTVADLRFTNPIESAASWFSMRILQTLQLSQGKETNPNIQDITGEDIYSGPYAGFGAVTSFRLKKYLEVGGYDRATDKWEDLTFAEKLNKHAGKFVGARVRTNIEVCFRRIAKILGQGGVARDQWNGDFGPVGDNEKQTALVQYLDTLIMKFKTEALSETEKEEVEAFMQQHYENIADKEEKQKAMKTFASFWNRSATDSKYKLTLQGKKLIIEDKLYMKYTSDFEIIDTLQESLITNKNNFSQFKKQVCSFENKYRVSGASNAKIENKIKEYKEFIEIFSYLLVQKPEEVIPQEKTDQKKIIFIGQSHFRVEGVEKISSKNKIICSQKHIFYFLKYFFGTKKMLIGSEGILLNNKQVGEELEKLDFPIYAVFQRIRAFLEKKKYITFSKGNIVIDKKYLEDIGKIFDLGSIEFLGKRFDKNKDKTLFTKACVYKYFFEILSLQEQDLLFYMSLPVLISQNTPHQVVKIEAFVTHEEASFGTENIDILTDLYDALQKQEVHHEISNLEKIFFSIEKSLGKTDFPEQLDILYNHIISKNDEKTLLEIKEKMLKNWYLLTKKREQAVMKKLQNFPKDQKILPLIFGATHMESFTDVVRKYNKENPDNKYALDTIDLSDIG